MKTQYCTSWTFASFFILFCNHAANASGTVTSSQRKAITRAIGISAMDSYVEGYRITANGKFLRQWHLQFPKSQPTSSSGNASDADALGFDRPAAICLTPDQRFAYVVNEDAGTVHQYRVTPDGHLKALAQPTVPAGELPCDISVDPTGHFAYVSNFKEMRQYRIGPEGALAPLDPAVIPGGHSVICIAMAVSRRGNLYVAGQPNDTRSFLPYVIFQYRISANGCLVPLVRPVVAAGSAPNGIILSSDGKFAYVTDKDTGLILTFRIKDNGCLVEQRSGEVSPYPDQFAPSGVAISPDNLYVYATSIFGPFVAQCRRNSEGNPVLLSPSVVRFPAVAWAIVFDPAGKYVYIPTGHTISRCVIGTTGTLRLLSPAYRSKQYAPNKLVFLRGDAPVRNDLRSVR